MDYSLANDLDHFMAIITMVDGPGRKDLLALAENLIRLLNYLGDGRQGGVGIVKRSLTTFFLLYNQI